jgi:DNA adenine methylase
MKPFLKWVGGKQQIISNVLELFPNEIQDYYEPFVGGGSVLLAFLSQVQDGKIVLHGKIYASDVNSHLIYVYKNIQNNPDIVINECKNIIKEYSECSGSEINRKPSNIEEGKTSQESYYYWIRKQYNELTSEQKQSSMASAMFIFLNKTCFRGLYREGPRGFNVPYGNYKNPSIIDEIHIRKTSDLIKDVIFHVASFEESLQKPQHNDFVYLDPPYAPESSTSFVSYTSDGFDVDKHICLFKTCHDLHTKKVHFLMSNADVKLIYDNFQTYNIKTILCKRSINSKKPNSKTTEVFIFNTFI